MNATRLMCITLESSLACNVEVNADMKHVSNKSRQDGEVTLSLFFKRALIPQRLFEFSNLISPHSDKNIYRQVHFPRRKGKERRKAVYCNWLVSDMTLYNEFSTMSFIHWVCVDSSVRKLFLPSLSIFFVLLSHFSVSRHIRIFWELRYFSSWWSSTDFLDVRPHPKP